MHANDFEPYVFAMNEEDRILLNAVKDFAAGKIKSICSTVRDECYFPSHVDSALRSAFWTAFDLMRDAGYTGLGLPEEYGGVPCSSKQSAIFTEELCRVDGAIGLSLGATLSLVAHPILIFGSAEQKDKWLKLIAAGRIVGCYAQTEPDAGSDVKNIATKALRDGGVWRISGRKVFITNGSESDLALVVARTGQHPYGGLSVFIVDMARGRQDGSVYIAGNEIKAGLHLSPTSELVFDGAEAELLGGEEMLGRGWVIAITTLASSRAMVIPAQGVGIARGAYEIIADYAQKRIVFGKAISDFPVNRKSLDKMQAMVKMARLLTWRACFYRDYLSAQNFGVWQCEASVAKRFAAETAEIVPSSAIQLAGGIGYITSFGLARYWKDGKIIRVYEGTDQIQELIIAELLIARMSSQSPEKVLSWSGSQDFEEKIFA